MKRRDFLIQGAASATLISIILTMGCGGSADDTDDSDSDSDAGDDDDSVGDDDDDGGTCATGDAQGPSILHAHIIEIPAEDFDNPTDGIYLSTGGDHDHDVAVSAAQLQELIDNCTVTVNSDDSHAHEWTLTFA